MIQKIDESSPIAFAWDNGDDTARRAAAFAGQVIGSDSRYISHGEIQTGLSDDGKTWVADLGDRYLTDFLDLGEDRDLLVASDAGGAIVGILVLA